MKKPANRRYLDIAIDSLGKMTGDPLRIRMMMANVPETYVMQPFEVKLAYKGQPWLTVSFELGANELGDADDADMEYAADVDKYFTELGFPAPAPVPLMTLTHQIAQKLHGLTEPGSDRVRDLVDLQIIVVNSKPDLHKTHEICKRLFSYRKRHAWPPQVIKGDDWERLYMNAKEQLPVLSTVEEAIDWANDLIMRINEA